MKPVNWTAVSTIFLVLLIVYGSFSVRVVQRARARSPRGIDARLRSPEDRVTVTVRDSRPLWDPGRPRGSSLRYGAARGTYTKDASGEIHLHYEPASGPAEDSHGPLPTVDPRQRRLMRIFFAAYAIVVLIGFIVGLVAGRGPVGERIAWGIGGTMSAMILIMVATWVALIGKAVRDIRKPRTPASW